MKYMAGNGISGKDVTNVWFCTSPHLKLDKSWGEAMLIQTLSRYKPSVLILDPFYKISSGRLTDEFDVRRIMDVLDIIKDKFKCAIIIIHHTRKPQMFEGIPVDCEEDDGFGSSMLNNWADTIIKIRADDRDITLKANLIRNADYPVKPLRFHIHDNLVFEIQQPKDIDIENAFIRTK